jgi:hypothetical protein
LSEREKYFFERGEKNLFLSEKKRNFFERGKEIFLARRKIFEGERKSCFKEDKNFGSLAYTILSMVMCLLTKIDNELHLNAAKFHCLRAHLQVVMWKQLTTQTSLHVEDWGWQLEDSALIPVATDIAAAPDDLLKVVRCKCRSESRNPCSSTLCSCRKHGLQCVVACKNCCGVSCDNASTVDYCASDNRIGYINL